MKKFFASAALVLALTLAFALVGCADNNLNTTPGGQGADATASVPADKSFDDAFDMAVVINGKTYPVGVDVNEVIAALGEGYEYRETISCTRNGMEKTYEYDGIRIETLPTDTNDIVCLYTITGGDYKTPRGVGVGSAEAEVFEAYGDHYFDGYYYVFTKSNDPNNIGENRIQIVIENGAVTEINVYSPDYAN